MENDIQRITATQTRLSNNEENQGNKTLSKNICFRTMCRRRFLWLCVLIFVMGKMSYCIIKFTSAVTLLVTLQRSVCFRQPVCPLKKLVDGSY